MLAWYFMPSVLEFHFAIVLFESRKELSASQMLLYNIISNYAIIVTNYAVIIPNYAL